MKILSDRILYGWLKRPIILARTIDVGEGSPVILLHGIGKSGHVWKHVVEGLSNYNYRILAFDLLGFGNSPKPNWIDYNIDDHAKAVIATLEKLQIDEPFVIVGHSMGCLIAVRVARLRPDLVRHLVLYEMPLYEGLPEKRIYKLRLGIYSRFYKWIINYKPQFDVATKPKVENLANKIIGFQVDKETWQPFIKSLENTIMKQTTVEDIKFLAVPMDVIYGSLDMLVIKGKTKAIFGSASEHVSTFNVRSRHIISTKASKLIVERIASSITASKTT